MEHKKLASISLCNSQFHLEPQDIQRHIFLTIMQSVELLEMMVCYVLVKSSHFFMHNKFFFAEIFLPFRIFLEL